MSGLASSLTLAALCLLAVLGYLDKKYFQQQVFRAQTFEGQSAVTSEAEEQGERAPWTSLMLPLLCSCCASVSALAARLFSAWCSITCALCVFLSYNIDNRALFVVTFFSFAVALAFFSMELIVYRTVDLRGVWMQGFIASMSLFLMWSYMEAHGIYKFQRIAF